LEWRREGDDLVIRSDSEAETGRIGTSLAQRVRPGLVVGLVGPLGAGKTRLVRAVAEAMGADESAIASPTFVLVHEYEARLPIYHFDAYRLASPEDFEAIGSDEYFHGQGVCFVEWADRVADLLPPSAWWIHAAVDGEGRVFRVRLDLESRDWLLREQFS
jgi:tRNA threonylcarbamoyladenosine biosynthesis protein TsaE